MPQFPPNRQGHHSTVYAGAPYTNNTTCSDLVSTTLAMHGVVTSVLVAQNEHDSTKSATKTYRKCVQLAVLLMFYGNVGAKDTTPPFKRGSRLCVVMCSLPRSQTEQIYSTSSVIECTSTQTLSNECHNFPQIGKDIIARSMRVPLTPMTQRVVVTLFQPHLRCMELLPPSSAE